jgi:hypothetical protein
MTEMTYFWIGYFGLVALIIVRMLLVYRDDQRRLRQFQESVDVGSVVGLILPGNYGATSFRVNSVSPDGNRLGLTPHPDGYLPACSRYAVTNPPQLPDEVMWRFTPKTQEEQGNASNPF